MEEYKIEEGTFYYDNGRWMSESFIEPPVVIVRKLNRLLLEKTDLNDKSMEELQELINRAKKSENHQLEIKALKIALERANLAQKCKLLPQLTSLYRKMGMPQAAIDISKQYTDEYKQAVWSAPLFTSIAAAFCDLGDYEKARKFANLANKISPNGANLELRSVYTRLNKAE